jgi:hypothetical protein
MTGVETLTIVAILLVFVFFMGVLAWGDRHDAGTRTSWK